MNPCGIHTSALTPFSGCKPFKYYWLFIWEVPLYHIFMAMSRGRVCEHICTVLGNGIERLFETKGLRAQGLNPHPSKTEECGTPRVSNVLGEVRCRAEGLATRPIIEAYQSTHPE